MVRNLIIFHRSRAVLQSKLACRQHANETEVATCSGCGAGLCDQAILPALLTRA